MQSYARVCSLFVNFRSVDNNIGVHCSTIMEEVDQKLPVQTIEFSLLLVQFYFLVGVPYSLVSIQANKLIRSPRIPSRSFEFGRASIITLIWTLSKINFVDDEELAFFLKLPYCRYIFWFRSAMKVRRISSKGVRFQEVVFLLPP